MRRTEMLQEIRMMQFEEVYFGWSKSRLTQEEAARTMPKNRAPVWLERRRKSLAD